MSISNFVKKLVKCLEVEGVIHAWLVDWLIAWLFHTPNFVLQQREQFALTTKQGSQRTEAENHRLG
jgi:hypothetical protein